MLYINIPRFLLSLTTVFALSFALEYTISLNKKNDLTKSNSEKIAAILTENFEHTEKILIFVGEKIANKNPDLNLKIILDILSEEASAIDDSKNIYSWTMFDWVNADGYQTANTALGIIKNPKRMITRNYRNRTNQDWKAIFSEETIGNLSGSHVIPVGVQIKTKKFPRAGTVVLGINIKKLNDIVKAQLDKNICFMVTDKRDNKFIFGTHDNIERNFYKTDSDAYLFYTQELDPRYPYKISAKYNHEEFWREIARSSAMLTTGITLIAVIFIALNQKRKRG